MKVNNQNSPSFGSTFVIYKQPMQLIRSVGRMGSVRGYLLKELPETEIKLNKRANKRILNFIKTLKEEFGKTNRIRAQRKYVSPETTKFSLKVPDNLDEQVESRLNKINEPKFLDWLFYGSFCSKIKFGKFNS